MGVEYPPANGDADVLESRATAAAHARRAGQREPEREFGALLQMLRPRIARLIRQYGLQDIHEDAHQAAAIGLHRALDSFDPARARFSTHVTWQMRGELQSLRHRMRLDQRRSARSAGVRTVALEEMQERGQSGRAAIEIVDETALTHAERAASDRMTRTMMERLLTQLASPAHECRIVIDHIFDRDPDERGGPVLTSEQRRQVVRRTMRNCTKLLTSL